MITNVQAQMGKVKPCPNGCGKDIYFESRFGPDGKLILKPDGNTKWWMMEDASKQSHQCPNNKFKKVAVEKTQDLVQKELLDENKLGPSRNAPEKLQARSMDVADFAEESMRTRVKLECKFISIIEDEVIKFLESKNLGTGEVNHAKVGLYIKIIKAAMEKNQ